MATFTFAFLIAFGIVWVVLGDKSAAVLDIHRHWQDLLSAP